MDKVVSITQKIFDINEIITKIPADYFVVFFAPVEKIDMVTSELSAKYKNVIGSSSFKNISADGCDYNSVNITGIKVTACKTLLIKDVKKSPIRQYKEIQKMRELYRAGHSIIIEFTDGLSLAEENVLTIINNELKDIPLIGGSAADNGEFKITKVSVGDKCYDGCTALAIITTDMFIDTLCENIYVPTDMKGILTESDLFNRKVIKINNKSALDFYCEKLNINKNKAAESFVDHPFARIIGEQSYIGSIMKLNPDNSMTMYCRIFENSYLSICKPIDYISLWESRVKENHYKYIGGIFINCIFRTNLFERDNTMGKFIKYLKCYGNFACMTSYGEQYNKTHANQTMTGCIFREN